MTDKQQPPTVPERIWLRPQAPFGLSALAESSRRLPSDVEYIRVHPVDDARVEEAIDHVASEIVSTYGIAEMERDNVRKLALSHIAPLFPPTSEARATEAWRIVTETAKHSCYSSETDPIGSPDRCPTINEWCLSCRAKDLIEFSPPPSRLKDGGAEARQLIQDLATFPFDLLMDEKAPRWAAMGSVSTLRHMQARAREIVATAPTESNERWTECENCHHRGSLNADGRCMVDISAYVDPGGPCHNQKECYCKCVFPASTEQAAERCIHCDPSFVPTGLDDYCYCPCHQKEHQDPTVPPVAQPACECCDHPSGFLPAVPDQGKWVHQGRDSVEVCTAPVRKCGHCSKDKTSPECWNCGECEAAQPEADPVDDWLPGTCWSVEEKLAAEIVTKWLTTPDRHYADLMSMIAKALKASTTTPTTAAVEAARAIAEEVVNPCFTGGSAGYPPLRDNEIQEIAAIISRYFPMGEQPDGFYWRGRYAAQEADLERLKGEVARLELLNLASSKEIANSERYQALLMSQTDNK